jgi:hypothetical protein
MQHKRLLWFFVIASTWTSHALAQEAASARPATVAGQLSFPDPRLRRLHGLYVRGGLGFGGIGNNVLDLDKNEGEERSEGTVTGMGLTSELSIGGTVGEN